MFFSNKKIEKLKRRVRDLEAQLAECHEVLEFYGSESNWLEGMKYRDADDMTVFNDTKTSAIAQDKGQRARALLQEDKTGLFGATEYYDKTEFKE